MATQLAAYSAAPVPPPQSAPMALYLVEDGIPVEVVGIDDFDVTIENPARKGSDAPELDVTMDYYPANAQHQALIAAGAAGGTLTVRVATRDSHGAAVACLEMDCTVVRYRLSMDDFSRHDDGKRLSFNIELEGVGAPRIIG